jgi:hypothetical protein
MLNWDLIKNLAKKSSCGKPNGARKHGMEKHTKGHFIQQHKQEITIVALLICTTSSPASP